MHCNTCDTANEADAKFCRACGAPFGAAAPAYVTSHAPMAGPACPACRQRNPRDARFCVFCATPLVQLAAPPVPALRTVRLGGAAPAMPAPVMSAPVIATATAVAYAHPQPVMAAMPQGTNLLLRAAWFFLIGWWLGLVWTIFAWLFNLTLIGLPVGLMMLNAIPTVMTLRPQHGRVLQMLRTGHQAVYQKVQQPFLLRAIWFVLIGWWASLLWMLVAWSLCSTILLMPIAFWMFDRVPTITTLAAE
jgi:uncharacterized membrane protein YccF (DUF307 family)